MKILKVIRQTSPKTIRINRLVHQGDAANRSRQWADAAAAYKQVLALAPRRASIHVQYGHALKEQGFLVEAEQAYIQAVMLEPSNADIHLQIGHLLKLRSDLPRAIAAYEEAHRLDPLMRHGRVELAQLRAKSPHLVISNGQHLQSLAPQSAEPSSAPGSTQALLATHGLVPDFLAIFDQYFYFQANKKVRQSLERPSREACLRHFCEQGLHLALPFAVDHQFDPAFYRETYLGNMAFTAGNAYRHWINVGLAQGSAPNRECWTRSVLAGAIGRLDVIDLTLFSAQDDGLASDRRWIELAQGFFDRAGDPLHLCAPDDRNVNVFHYLAARLEQGDSGQVDRGFVLRQLIADRVPSYKPNLERLANSLQHRGCFTEAARMYRELERDNVVSLKGRLGLASCEAGLGRLDQALETVQRACVAAPGDQGLRWQRIDRAQRLFSHAWSRGVAHARLGQIAKGQSEVAQACEAINRALHPYPPSRRATSRAIRRIALAAHVPLPQCRFYRIDQTAEQLRSMGYLVTIVDLATEAAVFHSALHRLDAVIFCRVPAVPIVVAAIEAADEFGLVTFYDMDDLIFDAAYPDPLESYGGLLSRDEHTELALGVPLFEQAMRLCTFGIASTPPLAEAMRQRVGSGRVFVRPNALGKPHLDFVTGNVGLGRSGEGPVTLFYGSGGKAHKADFQLLVEPALVNLVRRHGSKVAILLMGEFPDTEALRSIAANLTILPAVWDVESYWSVLASTDINLAVLLPGTVTGAKSAIKWLEAAMLGIPSVVSDTPTYRGLVTHGQTALVCRTAQDWTEALDELVRDASLRRQIGVQARTQAIAQFAPNVIATALDGFLQEVSPPVDKLPLVVIAHVFYPPQAVGGATRVVRDNVRDVLAIAGDRLRVEVFSCLDGGPPFEVTSDSQDGVRVTRVGSPDIPALEHRPTDARMGELFGDYLDQTRPALVHFHCIQRLTASIVSATAARGIPYIITVHDGWWISEHQFLLNADGQQQTYDMARPIATLQQQGPAAYARLVPLRQALLGARHVLAVSASFAKLYRECGVPNVIAVENGLPDLVPGLSGADRKPRPDGKVRIGFIGGLARHKGYDLVRIAVAARTWSNLVLLVIDHAMEPGTERHDFWGSVPVEFRPKWPQTDVSGLYGQIDVLLAPSIWPESYGLVTREAISAGCFVITSDRGSIGECVEHGRTGFVVDVSSPDGLIGALASLDAEPSRFCQPVHPPPMRRAIQQAEEITGIYDAMLSERT